MPVHTFILNGKRVSADVTTTSACSGCCATCSASPDRSTAAALGVCQACTCHINGKAFNPCSVPISQIQRPRQDHDDRGPRRDRSARTCIRCRRRGSTSDVVPVRLLPARPDHDGGRAGQRPSTTKGPQGHRGRPRRDAERVPLRHLPADPRGDQGRARPTCPSPRRRRRRRRPRRRSPPPSSAQEPELGLLARSRRFERRDERAGVEAALVQHAVDEERRRAGDAGRPRAALVARDALGVDAVEHLAAHALAVEPERRRVAGEVVEATGARARRRARRASARTRPARRPPRWPAAALSASGCAGQRHVAEGEAQAALEAVAHAADDRLRGDAVRALEVAVHDELEVGARRGPRRGRRGRAAGSARARARAEVAQRSRPRLRVPWATSSSSSRCSSPRQCSCASRISIGIPYPIVLVIGGVAIGFVPGLPDVELAPEAIFLLFLPPLLHSAGFAASPQELRTAAAQLVSLTFALVLVTMGAVAVVAHAVVDRARLAGGVHPGRDPRRRPTRSPRRRRSAASACPSGSPSRSRRRRCSTTRRRSSPTGSPSARPARRRSRSTTRCGSSSARRPAGSPSGSPSAGSAGRLQRRLTDVPLAIFLSVLFAYGAYVGAENIGASGVLATVIAGIWFGWHSHEMFDADTRLSAIAFWQALVFGLNTTLFVLLGLQFEGVLDSVRETGETGAAARRRDHQRGRHRRAPAVGQARRRCWRASCPRRGASTPARTGASGWSSAGRGCAARSRSPPRWR